MSEQCDDSEMLLGLQRETFDYFSKMLDPVTGLVSDSSAPQSPSSIAAVGLALTVWVVGVERKFITRPEAIQRTLKVLRFFHSSHQGWEKNATGYKGFYYHFLEMKTGERAWESELSTVDTALFIAGAISSAKYFSQNVAEENEIREITDFLYRRIDWQWALNGEMTVTHGWTPETGFLSNRWEKDYSEATILYVLAMGSPTFPISVEGYRKWTSTFHLSEFYGSTYLHAGPLFIHQMSQLWLNLKGTYDDFNRRVGFDYFENSRRATLAQRQYAIDNPKGFSHYGENAWGFTASDGPGPAEITINGVKRVFYNYAARGAPNDIDDGTIAPWAVVSSLPFSPKIVLSAIRHAIEKLDLKNKKRLYGFDASFNPTFPCNGMNPHGWISPWRFGLNQGPIVIMIENYQTGLIWKLLGKCPYILLGMKKAGFHELVPPSTVRLAPVI